MNRRRTSRPATHAQALIALAALPLVLTTSDVEVAPASAAGTDGSGAVSTAASLQAITAEDLTDKPETDGAQAVPAAFQVPERPALGNARAGDVPWAALQAYQRAADILGEVQPSCGLSWTLLGAIGQVESEHGSVRGSELGDDGVVTPALLSRPLDGGGARPTVEDTDGGKVDGDPTWDRAVGPMQLLPGVWALVGVDGDGDGTRSPQDVDDAALAVGVYLCATGADLADPQGAAEALAEYNGTTQYVDQVLAVERRYAKRDFAVSGAPEPTTIGATLDDSQGSPAQQSERALRKAEQQRQPEPLAARRADPAPDAATPSDAKQEPATGSKPSPAQATRPQAEKKADAAEEPADEPVVAAAEEPAKEDPSGQPTDRPADESTDAPAEQPAERPTDEATDQPAGAANEATDGPADEAGDHPADQPTEHPADQPTDEAADGPADEAGDGATDEAGEGPADEAGDHPADEAAEHPSEVTDGATDESDEAADHPEGPADHPEGPADEAGDQPADQPNDKPADGATDDAGKGPADEAGDHPADEPTDHPTDEATDEADAEPSTTSLTGVLSACGEGLCLDDAVLDLSLAGDLASDSAVAEDLDGDGALTTLAEELAGLEGQSVELLVVEGSEPLLVVAVDGHVIVPE